MKQTRTRAILPGLALAAVLGTALGTQAAAQDMTTADILNYEGDDREQMLYEGAKEEGELVIYSAMIVDQALDPLAKGFMAKYPEIEVTYWRGDSEGVAQRVLAESRAGNMVGDIAEGTSVGELLTRAGVAQPFTSPALADYPDEMLDPNKLWAPTRLSYYCMAYNTDLVPEDEVPTTFEDLLDPKWKGQIAWRIGSASGTPLFLTNLRTAWGEEKADEYFQKLAEQDVVNFGAGSARTLVDRVVAGEYKLAVNIFCHHPMISRADGAPVNSRLMDPVASTAATMLIPEGIPHPHAAALFTDFLLSEEGQEILLQANYVPAHPDVDPSELLRPIVPSRNGFETNFIGPDALVENTQLSDEVYQKYFR